MNQCAINYFLSLTHSIWKQFRCWGIPWVRVSWARSCSHTESQGYWEFKPVILNHYKNRILGLDSMSSYSLWTVDLEWMWTSHSHYIFILLLAFQFLRQFPLLLKTKSQLCLWQRGDIDRLLLSPECYCLDNAIRVSTHIPVLLFLCSGEYKRVLHNKSRWLSLVCMTYFQLL